MSNALETNIMKCFSDCFPTGSVYSPFCVYAEKKDWYIYIPAQLTSVLKFYLDKMNYNIPFFARIPKNMEYKTVKTQTNVDFDGCVLDGSQKLLFIKGAITNMNMDECYVMPCIEYKDVAYESETFAARRTVLLISKKFFKVKNALARRLVDKMISFVTNTVIINNYITIQANMSGELNNAESFSANLKSIKFVSSSMNVWGASKCHMEERMLANLLYGDFAESKSGFGTGLTPLTGVSFNNLDKDYKASPSVIKKLSKAFIEISKTEKEMANSFKENALKSDAATSIQNEYKECGLGDLEKLVIERLETLRRMP